MSTFDLLEKRRHVRKYTDKIPPKEQIEFALWQAWKTTPSKNQSMAYQVLVWGPDKKKENEAIWSLCAKSHRIVEETAIKEGYQTKYQDGGNYPNKDYGHIKDNAYLFTIHARLSKPNPYYSQQIKSGHFYDQMYEEKIEKIIDATAVEVGIFASNLSLYLLEQGIDMSYNSCFRRRPEEWAKVGLDYVKFRPISMISCGYSEIYRLDAMKERGQNMADRKPEYEDIIKWI